MSEYQNDLLENHIQGMGLRVDGVPIHEEIERQEIIKRLRDATGFYVAECAKAYEKYMVAEGRSFEYTKGRLWCRGHAVVIRHPELSDGDAREQYEHQYALDYERRVLK